MEPQGYYPQQGVYNQPPMAGSQSYNAANAFEQFYSQNGVQNMANYHQAYISTSTPGLPNDSFNRVGTFVSSRYTQPPSAGQKALSGLKDFFSGIGFVSKIVAYFYPPAAAVSTVAEIATPVLSTFQDNSPPKPVTYETKEKYNPWLR
ncbi:MAG: hypothetical protein U0457_14415 [Candidatus Sericytochromatia bacterium]